MKKLFLPRKPAVLSESAQRRLGNYAMMAGAAGVSMLALAQPAEAKIVYTPADVKIRWNQHYQIDLNHDGIPDFALSNWHDRSGLGTALHLGMSTPANDIWNASGYAAALREGVKVGPHGAFFKAPPSGLTMLRYTTDLIGGPWLDVKQAYLGLKFVNKGKVHYSWARVKIHRSKTTGIFATLTGYAYETIPNKSIITGKTKGPDVVILPVDTRAGTLGRLALGRK